MHMCLRMRMRTLHRKLPGPGRPDEQSTTVLAEMRGVSQRADVALTWGNFRFRLFLSQPQKPCLQRRPRDAPQRAPRAS